MQYDKVRRIVSKDANAPLGLAGVTVQNLPCRLAVMPWIVTQIKKRGIYSELSNVSLDR